ncbi:capsular polysaccharide export protein, LipB/KpsS family [Celeribacter litoreus]|uniref:capsular polysaccharide export protein, LipB/KpsS family n=1 Tax=Celeribacter litoreus TaxID=2876714 RepID=UPI001CCBD2BC|nr:capsular biosynthesis protein [Celeribacter litoreus]MCA0042261.1 capsular biosynthesis protein [Celeribacter litoreus]
MITYLKGFRKNKDSFMASVAECDGGGRVLWFIPLSLRDFPETDARVAEALAVAKRQPKGPVSRVLKSLLIRLQYNGSRRYFSRHREAIAMCWNGLTGSRRVFMEGARDAGVPTLYAELAPFPGRMQLDHTGVNACGSLPRDPRFYTAWANGNSERQGDGWRELGANLTARASRRADVGQKSGSALAGENFIFVPLQVPNDSQITMFSGWVGSVPNMIEMLALTAPSLPEGWHIRIKEHPSAKTSLAEVLERAVETSGNRIIIDNETDTFDQVRASKAVLTINSSVGLQAFFYDKPVIVLGEAFFALPGLVHPVGAINALDQTMEEGESLGFDPALRAAFMNYLDEVHFPKVSVDADGRVSVDEFAAKSCIRAARAAMGH